VVVFSGQIRKDTFMASTNTKLRIATGSSGLLPDSLVAERYKVTTRTIDRWDRDQNLEFPEALRIRGRKYRRINQLENWERQRATSDERRGSKRAATTQPAHAE